MSVRFRSSTSASIRANLEANGSLSTENAKAKNNWSCTEGLWELLQGDGERVSLIYSRNEKHSMRDFGLEVRPFVDVNRFVNKSALLLDLNESSIDNILDQMLSKILNSTNMQSSNDLMETRSSLFINDSAGPLSQSIRGACMREGLFEWDQSWIVIMATSSSASMQRAVAISRLKTPVNMGDFSQEVRLIALILCPIKEKGTKTALQTGITFATIFADIYFRQHLLDAKTEDEFLQILSEQAQAIASKQQAKCNEIQLKVENDTSIIHKEQDQCCGGKCTILQGLKTDLRRRLKYYLSDYVDGVRGPKTIQKLMSTILFLYFACLLPCIAFGSLNDRNTRGHINVQKVILGQGIGGVFFAIFGGQPLLILLTTAPLALYTQTVYNVSLVMGIDFFAVFACVGLWNTFFLVLYSVLDASKIMKWCTRSTEEIFALFITVAFFVDAFTHVHEDFWKNYNSAACVDKQNVTATDQSGWPTDVFYPLPTLNVSQHFNMSNDLEAAGPTVSIICNQASSILYLFLMFGTLWLGLFLYDFIKTPYLGSNKREIISDYSLPIAVLFFSFVGSYIFKDVKMDTFNYEKSSLLSLAPFEQLTVSAVFISMGLGFCLSVLFFMDQNISAAMVNNPSNKLKKGPAYHYDLLAVGLLNGFLSIFCLPWMHAAIPHCPLHVQNLADIEERVDQGMVYQIIVRVRETRLTALIANFFIGLSVLLLPYPLAYIPTSVLDGLFLYVAITGLYGNQLFDRILLFCTEQAAYPPSHYVRHVPQRKIHLFTVIQLVQFGCLCFFGFFPIVYLKMAFPLWLFLLIPIRHLVTPHFISLKFLAALDGNH